MSVTDDDGPYSLSYPSNSLVSQTQLFGIPNISPGKGGKVKGGSSLTELTK